MVLEFGTMEEEGMDTSADVTIESLDDVKEEKQLVPPARGVKLKVRKAEINKYNEDKYCVINLQLQIVDGINDDGEYKGKVVFGKVNYAADPATYTKDYFVKKQHLIQAKGLLKAIGMELAQVGVANNGLVKKDGSELVTDQFCEDLKGMVIIGDIKQTKGNEQYGPDNEVVNFKAVSAESLV